MRIAAMASAFPGQRYEQAVNTDTLEQQWGDRLDRPERFDRIQRRAGVDGRHLALPIESYRASWGWDEANAAWLRVAEDVGEQALGRALERAGLEPAELDALFLVSITGIASPSLDARLTNRMGLSPRLKRLPIFGLGCVGGAAGSRVPRTTCGPIRLRPPLSLLSSSVR